MERGKFITFEGPDGGGKSTQAGLLAIRLKAHGLTVALTREPGGAAGAEDIRKLLVSGEVGRWRPMSEALLNYAARFEHIEATIEPALAAGKWVISDRFADSTLAYQGYGHGLDREIIARLHRLVCGGFRPELTLILDIAVEDGLRRTVERKGDEDRFERMGRDFHERLRAGFLEIADREVERCAVIDAANDVETVERQVRKIVSSRLAVDI